jgi:two-component system KDP operon response regulator KdpE
MMSDSVRDGVGRRGRLMTRLLVVDDEAPFVRALSVNLRAQGYDLDVARTGEQGLQLARDRHPDLVILDLGLPGIDGFEVLRNLRTWSAVPVLVLSASALEKDTVAAFDAGADDFMAKPFGVRELHARVRAALRRGLPSPVGRAHVETDHFVLDLDIRHASTSSGTEIHLTPTEWRLLELLVGHEDQPLSTDQILGSVWGPHVEHKDEYVRAYIWGLRQKLEPDPSAPRHLTTDRGLGYRFTRSARQPNESPAEATLRSS